MIKVPLLAAEGEAATYPTFAKIGDAAVDLVAREDAVLQPRGGRAVIGTGLKIALPQDCAGLVLSRSGLAAHHGVACLNAPGLIDSGYRGEIAVILVNTDVSHTYEVRHGDRIAQLLIVRLESFKFFGVGSIDVTERGEQGFGHSGR